jgi:hypothetical protein
MPISVGFSALRVSAGFMGIRGRSWVAEESYRSQEYLDSSRNSAMATIRAPRQADGSTRHTAIVRIRRGKTIVHREYKTFALRTAAASWAKHREVALEQPGALTRVNHGAPTLAELIRWYIETFESVSKQERLFCDRIPRRQDNCRHLGQDCER